MNIDPCRTWECVNSFSSWLSAVGTIVISGLALWLAVRDRLINLKVSLSTGLIPGDDPSVLDQRVFILEYVNTGPRPVTITNHYWKLPFTRTRTVVFPQLQPKTGIYCARMPLELSDGKSANTFYPIHFFRHAIDDPETIFFPKQRWRAWVRIHFFSVLVPTSTGKVVRAKIRKGVRQTLWRQRNAA